MAAACTAGGSDSGDATTTSLEAATTTTASATAAPSTTTTPVELEVDRLVILGIDGNVYTVDRDGNERIDLTEDADRGKSYFQPVWSPDGATVAVSETGPDGSSMTAIDVETGEALRTAASGVPFYFYWAPDGEKLVYLSGGGQLTLTLVTPGEAGEVIASGQPFYFSWAPTSDQLLVHVGETRLEELDLDGTLRPVEDAPGLFQAPSWQGDATLYVRSVDGRQELVLKSTTEVVVASFSTASFFSLSPDGSRVAYRVVGGGDDGVISAAFQQTPTDTLLVYDAGTDERWNVTSDRVVAFWWSPDGDKLLYLELAANSGFAWRVWEDGESTEYGTFLPSPTFVRDFLPFFDQYGLSMTLWSPDSTAFAYPGAAGSEVGIWVQHLDDAEPRFVGDGVFVGWSPR